MSAGGSNGSAGAERDRAGARGGDAAGERSTARERQGEAGADELGGRGASLDRSELGTQLSSVAGPAMQVSVVWRKPPYFGLTQGHLNMPWCGDTGLRPSTIGTRTTAAERSVVQSQGGAQSCCSLEPRCAQVDLLANVGALLADTRSLLTRLAEGDASDGANNDDGGFFEAIDAPGRQLSPVPPGAAAAANASQLAGLGDAVDDETAVDEVYEFQVRYCWSLRWTWNRAWPVAPLRIGGNCAPAVAMVMYLHGMVFGQCDEGGAVSGGGGRAVLRAAGGQRGRARLGRRACDTAGGRDPAARGRLAVDQRLAGAGLWRL